MSRASDSPLPKKPHRRRPKYIRGTVMAGLADAVPSPAVSDVVVADCAAVGVACGDLRPEVVTVDGGWGEEILYAVDGRPVLSPAIGVLLVSCACGFSVCGELRPVGVVAHRCRYTGVVFGAQPQLSVGSGAPTVEFAF